MVLSTGAAKFFAEHLLAPRSSGISGALAQKKLDLLLIGSSHTRMSYDMRRFEEFAGLSSSFLVAYDGADLRTISQIMDYLVSRPDKCPLYMVIEAYSAMLARGPDLQDPRFFFDAPPPLKERIIRSYLSSHGNRAALLDIFDLLVNRGNEVIVSYPLNSLVMQMSSYKGGRMEFSSPGVSPETFRNFVPRVVSGTPDPFQVSALNHILDLAANSGVSVFFIETPLPGPVSSDKRIQSLKAQFRQILRGRQVRYIDGDLDFPINDPSLFCDDNHLSTTGRERFTAEIGPEVKSWMDSISLHREPVSTH